MKQKLRFGRKKSYKKWESSKCFFFNNRVKVNIWAFGGRKKSENDLPPPSPQLKPPKIKGVINAPAIWLGMLRWRKLIYDDGI